MIIRNIDEAAYLNISGFKVGLITKSAGNMADIEIKGNDEEIQKAIQDFHNGAKVNGKQYYDSLGFIRYIINQRCNK